MTSAFGLAVDTLASTSLEVINSDASLQTRVDRKYVVDTEVAARLVAGFDGAVLDIDGSRQFTYETIYYDTPRFDLYLDTAYRRPKRFKVRVRRYVDSGLTMIEVKTKNGRGKTVKFRREYVPVGGEFDPSAALFLDEVRSYVDEVITTDLTELLVPSLVTAFERTTLLGADGASRYTIDRELRATANDGRVVSQPAVVIESKSAGATSPVDRWLWQQGIRPSKMSKYCTAMAVLHPSLPSNHWHRTLRRHFGIDRSPARPQPQPQPAA